jgi:two-component system NtrC family sensor kinase
MAFLSISRKKCRRCYRCIRECPTNALKIDNGAVVRIESRCVLCGTCFKNCPHDAVIHHTGIDKVIKGLDEGQRFVACVAPTFPAVLDVGTPGQLVTALKKLGFHEVWESAVGGDLVFKEYKKWLLQNNDKFWISSFCPSLVLYVEKFAPQFVERLVPVISPMAAVGMTIKELRGSDIKVVFIGACISRIHERMSPHIHGAVDFVLTYHDIRDILKERGIDREEQEPSDFDGPRPGQGRLLSVAGGMSQCIGFEQDLLNLDYVVEAGPDRAMRAIHQLKEGTIRSHFLDLLFCKGCINGPMVDRNISGPSRKQIFVDFIKSQDKNHWMDQKSISKRLKTLDFKRDFSVKDISLPDPSEAEIRTVLREMGKSYPKKNLDCGFCGFDTCREKAIAVVQGLAEKEMCPHFLLAQARRLYTRLEKSHEELKISHEELGQAQKKLIQSEKMASLGQLAAGVAHELNNPLGTITLFGRMLQTDLTENEKWKKDITLIVQEAERAAKIVKDLLSFSRDTKLRPGLVNINNIIEEALSLVIKRSLFRNIVVQREMDPSLPTTFADPDLLMQVFLNIILNGAQAMEGQGILLIKSHSVQDDKELLIHIEDTGTGIAKEHLPRLFDPFFTTKEKGTGLGLALVYGIISKHKGSIQVESELGKGTIIFIHLPVLNQDQWMEGEKNIVDMKKVPGGGENDTKSEDLIG